MWHINPQLTQLIARDHHEELLRQAGHGRPLHESHRSSWLDRSPGLDRRRSRRRADR